MMIDMIPWICGRILWNRQFRSVFSWIRWDISV